MRLRPLPGTLELVLSVPWSVGVALPDSYKNVQAHFNLPGQVF